MSQNVEKLLSTAFEISRHFSKNDEKCRQKNVEKCRKVASSKKDNIFIYFRQAIVSEEIAKSPDLVGLSLMLGASGTGIWYLVHIIW